MFVLVGLILGICLVASWVQVHGFSMQPSTLSAAEQIRGAMKLTTEGQSNITAAHLAVSMWKHILDDDDGGDEDDRSSSTRMRTRTESIIQPSIRVLCNPLYASSLSRIGRDGDAIVVYDKTLSLIESMGVNINMDGSVLMDVRVGKAECLQRLIRYEAAGKEFLAAYYLGNGGLGKAKKERCAYSASICLLRQGDLQGAESLLFHLFKGVRDLSSLDHNLLGLYGTIRFELDLQGETLNEERDDIFFTPTQMLQFAASLGNASPLYQWLYAHASKSSCNIFQGITSVGNSNNAEDKDKFLRIASINQCPFDDHQLINLDDKILLHDLLIEHKEKCFWPNGFVLPRDEQELQANYEKDGRWMSKERAGYGSHGNRITTAKEAIILSRQNRNEDTILCQKLIEPSLLLNNRKFSIRVYVVYFNQEGEIFSYLLNTGLVKLAETDYNDSSTADDMYMTNSGRGEGDTMTQHDLQYLQKFLENEYGNEAYQEFWEKIKDSATNVIRVYGSSKRDELMTYPDNSSSLFASVPKIFGFDYILDSSCNPVLLEVNRFPGLEARGESDYSVKYQVVRTAWILGSMLSKIDCGFDQIEMENIHFKSVLLDI